METLELLGPLVFGKLVPEPLALRAPVPKTPGAKRASSYGSRPGCGSCKTSCVVKVFLTFASSVSKGTFSEVTVTTSLITPAASSMSTPLTDSASTAMSSTTCFLKLCFSTVSVYAPGESPEHRYYPPSLVVVVSDLLVPLLVSVTVALGTSTPLVYFTVAWW